MLLKLHLMINFFLLIMVFISVAFITLLERKILGLIQFRLGPNKVLMSGIFQPLADALKLFSKMDLYLYVVYGIEYNMMPIGMLMLMMMLWMVYPISGSFNMYKMGLLLFICLLSLGVYPIMFGGWFSGSLYSMLGSIRSVAQMISYEVSFIMIMMMLIYCNGTFSVYNYVYCEMYLFMWPVLILLYISIVIELNRTPADLIEGESELVSGFNTEYTGYKFAMIFLGEYGMLLALMGLYTTVVFGLYPYTMMWSLVVVMLVFMVILLRGILPRIRYDNLMYFCWVSVLTLSTGVLTFIIGVIMLIKIYLIYLW